MVQHVVNVTATSNSSVNTQDLFLEFGGATTATVKMKRCRVGFGSGQQASGIDNNFLIQILIYTTTTGGSAASLSFSPAAAGSGDQPVTSTSFGNVWTSRNANTSTTLPASLTAKVKNNTTALAIGSGSVQYIDQISPNGRALYEWLARDDDDMIVSKPANFIAVALSSNVASQVFTVTCDFII